MITAAIVASALLASTMLIRSARRRARISRRIAQRMNEISNRYA